MSQVYFGINESKFCSRIFVDILKAFDTVDHEIFLTWMHDAGFRDVGKLKKSVTPIIKKLFRGN